MAVTQKTAVNFSIDQGADFSKNAFFRKGLFEHRFE